MSARAKLMVDCLSAGVGFVVCGFAGLWLISLWMGKPLEMAMAVPLLTFLPVPFIGAFLLRR